MKDGIAMTYDNIVKYAQRVYKILNGWINPYLHASDLVINYENFAFPEPCPGDISITIGSSIMSKVFFNPNALIWVQLYEMEVNNNPVDKHTVKSLIIDVIAHELSHVNQQIDGYLFDTDEEYRNRTESENELNALRFLRKHHKKLVKKLGEFDPYIMGKLYNKKCQVKIEDYKRLRSISKLALSYLKSIYRADIEGIFRDFKDIYPVTILNVYDKKPGDGALATFYTKDMLDNEGVGRHLVSILVNYVYTGDEKCKVFLHLLALEKEKAIYLGITPTGYVPRQGTDLVSILCDKMGSSRVFHKYLFFDPETGRDKD